MDFFFLGVEEWEEKRGVIFAMMNHIGNGYLLEFRSCGFLRYIFEIYVSSF